MRKNVIVMEDCVRGISIRLESEEHNWSTLHEIAKSTLAQSDA